MVVWKDFNRRNTLEAKGAYFNEFTRYLDPKAEVYSVIRSQTAVAAFESNWDLFRNASLFAGSNYTYEYADLDYYSSPEHQQSFALYLSWMQEFQVPGWQLSLNARQEFLTDYNAPFLYSIGAAGKIWQFISGRISFSRNFRAPTLNERYWQPGGDPEIEPEASYNLETGISLKPVTGKLESEMAVTIFSSWVNDWILWQPDEGTWSVENAQKVWSRGMEISINEIFRKADAIFSLYGSYSMTFSTNEKKLSEFDESYQKQLIYTPVHRMILKPGMGWKGFQFTLRGSLTGEAFTSKDNEESLPPFFLLDAIISKEINLIGRAPVSFQVNLNNITNLDYQVVPYRPMPGFNVMGTVVVRFAVRSSQSAVSDQ
jgi:iron complex outermembrane receptor protein